MAIDSDLVYNSTIHALILAFISNVVAQLITSYKSNESYSIDTIKLMRYLTFQLLNTPPNLCWAIWLETKFPRLSTAESPGTIDSIAKTPAVQEIVNAINPGSQDEKARETDAKSTRDQTAQPGQPHGTKSTSAGKINVKNTAIKFVLEQTIAAVVNTFLFIAGMDLLAGQSWEFIKADVIKNFMPIITAGQKFWPLVSVMQFAVVPIEYRALVGGIVGIFWGTYLNMIR